MIKVKLSENKNSGDDFMSETAHKMFEIAKYLDELKDGKVKGFKGNEKGYAKIIEICRGCSIWLHHEKSDNLIIDLLISPSAKEKNSVTCKDTVEKFKNFFDFAHNESEWRHSIDKRQNHDRYYVVVTEKNTSELIDLVKKIERKFK